MTRSEKRCPACRKLVKLDARFCLACGKNLSAEFEQRDSRSIGATVLIFVGVFVSFFLTGLVAVFFEPTSLAPDVEELVWQTVASVFMLGFGGLALKLLGTGSWRRALAARANGQQLALGVLCGTLAFGVSYLYVKLLTQAVQGDVSPASEASLLIPMVAFVLLAAPLEEFLDRGVLWSALASITTPAMTIFATSLLFAFSHGLNGGGLFEVPHRFVVGLLLGWLRHRTGSLLPCIAGHMTLNALAVVL